mmetsp:Transcript_401/g.1193  ORF Transcript_401/g.1193 Transcript_401/m.1193 type:complete len:386 (-) Transcript_401:2257-3414(-)
MLRSLWVPENVPYTIAGAWGVAVAAAVSSAVQGYINQDKNHSYLTPVLDGLKHDSSVERHVGAPVSVSPFRRCTLDSMKFYARSEVLIGARRRSLSPLLALQEGGGKGAYKKNKTKDGSGSKDQDDDMFEDDPSLPARSFLIHYYEHPWEIKNLIVEKITKLVNMVYKKLPSSQPDEPADEPPTKAKHKSGSVSVARRSGGGVDYRSGVPSRWILESVVLCPQGDYNQTVILHGHPYSHPDIEAFFSHDSAHMRERPKYFVMYAMIVATLLVAGFGGLHLYNKIKDAMGAGFGRRFVLNHPQIRAVIGGRPSILSAVGPQRTLFVNATYTIEGKNAGGKVVLVASRNTMQDKFRVFRADLHQGQSTIPLMVDGMPEAINSQMRPA